MSKTGIFRSYIGITGNWIEPENLNRVSCLLAIKRIKGHHNYDILAQKITLVYEYYKISEKISYTTTDNASNFVKCFR